MLRRSLRIFKSGQCLFASSHLKLHTSVFPVLHSKFDKNLPNPAVPIPISKAYGPDTDILLDQIKSSTSVNRLLELINMHLDVMNSKHMVVCLENINNCVKEDNSISKSLVESYIFKSFSARLMKVIRLFEPQEVITAYKTFCTLEIRNNTYVMQCILKMLGAHLNNMNLGQLTFLSFLLHKQRHNVLVDGLKLAIPLVLQVQIDHQLDSDNLTEVVKCLQISCRSGLKAATIQKIIDVIVKKSYRLSTEDAVTVIFSLLHIHTPLDNYNVLINIAFDVVSRNIEDVPPKKLSTIVRSCHSQDLYPVTFLYKVADFVASQKWSLELTYYMLSNCYALGFCPANLVDHFAEVLYLESKTYQSDSFYSPLSCIEYLTATSYRPAKVDEAARVLYSCKDKIEDLRTKNPYLLLKFLSCLAIIGHFPHELLSILLEEEFLFSAWSLSRKLGKSAQFDRYIFALHWSFDVYDETKNFSIPPTILKKILQSLYQKVQNVEYPLTKFIENGLGGSQFLQTGLYTEDGHTIDYVVAMRAGNYPVSLENMKSNREKERPMPDLKFVEDITLPEDAKIVAVLLGKENDYFRDPQILRGWMDVKVRSLAKKNYAVSVISHTVWKELPDREKIPYIMREIKQVIPDECAQGSNYL